MVDNIFIYIIKFFNNNKWTQINNYNYTDTPVVLNLIFPTFSSTE